MTNEEIIKRHLENLNRREKEKLAMIDIIMEDMESWDTETIIGYALQERREQLDSSEDEYIEGIFRLVFSESEEAQ